MKIGPYTISTYNHGYLKLDGGSMFGAVPKNLWQRLIPADEQNRIRLATRSLLIKSEDKLILVDVGNGDKWTEKLKRIYSIENTPEEEKTYNNDEITHIILTHLHFDHAAGLTRLNDNGELELTYPNAKVIVQKSNYENAQSPNTREKASYLKDHVEPLKEASLEIVDGTTELFPGITVRRSDGHTTGLQHLEIKDSNQTLLFPSDLCPTSRHLPLAYNMGYDMCTDTLLKEKAVFLEQAVSSGATVVFEHDPEVAAATICLNEKGQHGVKEQINL